MKNNLNYIKLQKKLPIMSKNALKSCQIVH